MTISERIAKCRKEKNLSQEYIAELLEVSRQAVSKWENDQTEPDTSNLIKLARVFGVSVEYLANGGGAHSYPSCATDDHIPPVLDITLSIELDKKPQKLILQPENRELEFEYKDGRAYVEINRVDIHSIIEICN